MGEHEDRSVGLTFFRRFPVFQVSPRPFSPSGTADGFFVSSRASFRSAGPAVCDFFDEGVDTSFYAWGLYTPWLKPLGLTYTQYIVFLVLWEKDGVSVTEIGEKLMLDNGTLSPLLKKLERAGYVERRRSREDDRVVEITLTGKGRALQEKAKDIPGKVAGCIDLPPEKARTLYSLLYELLRNRKDGARSLTADPAEDGHGSEL